MKIYFSYIIYGLSLYILISLFTLRKKIILFKHPTIHKTKNNNYYTKLNENVIFFNKEEMK